MDCDMIENPPSVNDGEDEDEEVEGLHHESCLPFVACTWSLGSESTCYDS